MNKHARSRKIGTAIALLSGLAVFGCGESSTMIEREAQERGVLAIVQNQPVPDLGGYSLERQILIETYLARNRTVATYTYALTLEGKIIEICASIGYPIPYSTQLTNPERWGTQGGTIPQAEPNGLFPPTSADATLVNCTNDDGSVTPTYWEPHVFAQPYRIRADIVLERTSESAFTVSPKGGKAP